MASMGIEPATLRPPIQHSNELSNVAKTIPMRVITKYATKIYLT